MPDAAYRVAIHTRIVTRKSRVARAEMWELFRERGRRSARFDRFRLETSFTSAFLAEALTCSRWMENSLPFTAEERSRRMLITRRELRRMSLRCSVNLTYVRTFEKMLRDFPGSNIQSFRLLSRIISHPCVYIFLLNKQMQSKMQFKKET